MRNSWPLLPADLRARVVTQDGNRDAAEPFVWRLTCCTLTEFYQYWIWIAQNCFMDWLKLIFILAANFKVNNYQHILKIIRVKGPSDQMLTVVMQSVEFTRRDVNLLAIAADLAASAGGLWASPRPLWPRPPQWPHTPLSHRPSPTSSELGFSPCSRFLHRGAGCLTPPLSFCVYLWDVI